MTTCAFLSLLAIAACSAFLLGLAVSLPYMLRPRPSNDNVWVRHD